jgi:hypothetical protein
MLPKIQIADAETNRRAALKNYEMLLGSHENLVPGQSPASRILSGQMLKTDYMTASAPST